MTNLDNIDLYIIENHYPNYKNKGFIKEDQMFPEKQILETMSMLSGISKLIGKDIDYIKYCEIKTYEELLNLL